MVWYVIIMVFLGYFNNAHTTKNFFQRTNNWYSYLPIIGTYKLKKILAFDHAAVTVPMRKDILPIHYIRYREWRGVKGAKPPPPLHLQSTYFISLSLTTCWIVHLHSHGCNPVNPVSLGVILLSLTPLPPPPLLFGLSFFVHKSLPYL